MVMRPKTILERLEEANVANTWPHSRASFFAFKAEVDYVKPEKQDVEDLIAFLKDAQATWMKHRPDVFLLSKKLGDWIARGVSLRQKGGSSDFSKEPELVDDWKTRKR